MCVSSKDDYSDFLNILNNDKGEINLKYRKNFAFRAFNVSSHYDTAIFNYFKEDNESLKASYKNGKELRYGENPHQKGMFYGDFNSMFEQLHGKELSYNNLLDVDAAVNLILEFYNDMPTFAILKHNNACGLASRNSLLSAYKDALAGDPVSAFGGVLISNKSIDVETAEEINKLFCEVVIAPGFEESAIKLLKSKKNRILLVLKNTDLNDQQLRTCLNGVLTQDKDSLTDSATDFKTCTEKSPNKSEIKDLEFASKICKHTKSNTIVLAKNLQLISSGTGQTSRVDALKQAIEKSNNFKFDLNNSVMASDAFFPFPDCVEIAHKSGISSVIQPGGSIKDDLSIEYCNKNNISMVLTGTRHFKH
jgi:phosphoribosylaminoimidazolecarboxamide formyltransferase/IMP cyclohydrolase